MYPSNKVLLFPHALWLSTSFFWLLFQMIDSKITIKPNDS